MDADLFLQQFGHLAQGEGGIKKLRDVILQLAVQGKLVDQNPADESAEMLLKKVEAERKKLAKAGRIKMPKLTPTISPTKTTFGLPSNWAWTRLGNIGSIFNGDSISVSEKEREYTKRIQGYNYIATKDVDFVSRKINYDNGIKIPFDNKGFKVAHKGAVLICAEGGSAGKKIAITEEDICFGNKLYAIETFSGLFPRYLFYVYQSPYFYKEFSLTTTGIIGGTSINKFNQIPVPIPPFEEQKRIVAKVDQLMVLCDKLEAEQKAQRTLKTQAMQSTLHHLTSAESTASFGNSLNILEHTFGTWFDDLATVKHLRATILQLAVQGKLVPQNPTDEPASVLLERIEAEKKRLVEERKKTKTDFSVTANIAHLSKMPNGWALPRLDLVSNILSGNAFLSGEFNNVSGTKVIKITNVGVDEFIETNEFLPIDFSEKFKKFAIKENDILIALTRPYITDGLKVARCPSLYDGALLNQRVGAIQTIEGFVDSGYLYLFLRSSNVLEYIKEKSRTQNQPNLNVPDLRSLLVPFPPLAEQKRIVAKVDELMTLCDQLEAHITHKQTLNTHLMDSLIHRMTEAA